MNVVSQHHKSNTFVAVPPLDLQRCIFELRYIRGMFTDASIFKIESNHAVPARGKVLISEPFLCDNTFGRSVILLIDHTEEGSMGLVLNKKLPLSLHHLLEEFEALEGIPLYKGGPLCGDTLFYLHTINGIADALHVSQGLYLNGNFEAIRRYLLSGKPVRGKIRFFLGYSGWAHNQLHEEIEENTWIVSKEETEAIMNDRSDMGFWKEALEKLGGKYGLWARFPQLPILN